MAGKTPQDIKSIETARNLLEIYLKNNHLRKTPERFTILEAIFTFSEPFNIHDMQEKIQTQKIRTSLATIYNTFIILEKAHLLLRTKPEGRYSRFIANRDTEAKNFLICTQCGMTKNYPSRRLMRSIRTAKLPRFEGHSYSLYIMGICYNCQKLNEKKNSK